MPRRIRQIEIYLPLNFNDGTPIAPEVFRTFELQLLNRFGGVTSTHREYPLQGLWQSDNTVYQDRIVVFEAIDFMNRSEWDTMRFLTRIKSRLKKKLEQLDELITVQELTAI